MDVVHEAYQSDEREAKQEPAVAQAKESGIEPCTKQENNPSTPKRDGGMTRSQIRLIYDIEPVGHPEICQFQQNQQYENNCVNHNLS